MLSSQDFLSAKSLIRNDMSILRITLVSMLSRARLLSCSGVMHDLRWLFRNLSFENDRSPEQFDTIMLSLRLRQVENAITVFPSYFPNTLSKLFETFKEPVHSQLWQLYIRFGVIFHVTVFIRLIQWYSWGWRMRRGSCIQCFLSKLGIEKTRALQQFIRQTGFQMTSGMLLAGFFTRECFLRQLD